MTGYLYMMYCDNRENDGTHGYRPGQVRPCTDRFSKASLTSGKRFRTGAPCDIQQRTRNTKHTTTELLSTSSEAWKRQEKSPQRF